MTTVTLDPTATLAALSAINNNLAVISSGIDVFRAHLNDDQNTIVSAQTSIAAIVAALTPPQAPADGSAGAPAGAAQYASMLSTYKARPAWNVAGVDYAVGIPAGTTLTDWRTLTNPALGINTTTGLIYFNSDAVLSGIDFSLGTGAALYNPAGRANNITITNCYFCAPSGGQSGFPLLDQNMANVVIQNCKFDGSGAGGSWNSFLATNGNLTLLYNWFINSPSQILQWNPAASGKIVTAKYNFYDNMRLSAGAHRNYLEINANNVTIGYDVEYNTSYQDQSCGGQGGEGFQIYSNGTGVVLTNPIISCNTMIAKPGIGSAPLGMPTMSALIHGCGGGTTISGTGQNNNNHFDVSGALSAFYGGTMTAALGWTSAGNADMNTGALITPA